MPGQEWHGVVSFFAWPFQERGAPVRVLRVRAIWRLTPEKGDFEEGTFRFRTDLHDPDEPGITARVQECLAGSWRSPLFKLTVESPRKP